MPFLRYISDNPFRLLGIGSAVSHRELRRLANAAAIAWKVGEAPASSLDQLFGVEHLDHCADIVRALAEDPVQRTVYRLFWPFEYVAECRVDGSLADFDSLITKYAQTSYFQGIHLRFLQLWFGFEAAPTVYLLREALASFCELYENGECDQHLARLLESEGLDENKAFNSVYEAQERAMAQVLDEACGKAIACWHAGDVPLAISLLREVRDSSLLEDSVDSALRAVIPLGEQEMARIRKAMEEFRGWSPEQVRQDLARVEGLKQLTDCVRDRVPAAGLWSDIVDRRIEQIVGAIRADAVRLANEEHDYSRAETILMQALALPLPEVWKQRIQQDRVDLEEARADHERWKDIEETSAAPSLHTVNGVGTRLYGRTPFAGRVDTYLANLYFVILYLPIYPIARYLVRDAVGGGWYFLGKARLRKIDRVHRWATLAAALIGCGWLYLASGGTQSNVSVATAMPAAQAPPSSPAPSPTPLPHAAVRKYAKAVRTARPHSQPRSPVSAGFLAKSDLQPKSAAQEAIPFIKSNAALLADRSVLAADIDAGVKGLKEDTDAVDRERQALNAERDVLDGLKQQLRATMDRIDSDRGTLDTSSESEVSAFNTRVRQCNSDKDAYNAKVDQYNSDKDAFNAHVDTHNDRVARMAKKQKRLREIDRTLEQDRNQGDTSRGDAQ